MHRTPITRAWKRTARPIRIAACVALLLSPLTLPAQDETPGIAFSTLEPGGPLPAGWKNLPVVHGKAMTQYTLVHDGNKTVLQADADRSASALMHEGNIDLAQTPVVAWRWKAEKPIEGADNRVGSKEDAPARLVFTFDGDVSKLSIFDRTSMAMARRLGGQDLPYATLMYIWSTSAAPGSVIANPHTGRVQMIVVSGQPGDAGQWQTLRRNVVQDYEKVFHEPPGRIIGYGLLTDTDNTGTTTRAWYGDIHFLPGP
ncbi:DUF3047 domain-containing protein [Paraburkholderia unamae]|uniref:DUF3047 family protein n=1 Tax=Paraburkholderia unamae TaxID=219649 RepID=A0ABX5KF05_9BURK|nr:DUF3047 domain-containing protein [Paraburkholderia unamae]PVX75072.1 hypothetical protein C7402_1183 [Paraburkholderia unamae]CAG9257117.1 conserved exported hypothetical protein [Paraburkholderia unamae]